MRTLDVGCGIRKQPGSIGIDRNPASRADVLVDLDRFPYPFADNSFDRIIVIHVIEHVSDVIRAMEEFHRLARPGGTVRIETPHYTDFSSFCDPRREPWRLRLLLPSKIPRDFRARKATGILEMAGIPIPSKPVSPLPALLGVLSVLPGPRQGNGVRIPGR